jgi:3-oxoacyl-[acyl-carrier protein] reductase
MGVESVLKGKKAIVTGGTRGIGRAIAKMLLQSGAEVLICARSEASVSAGVEALKAETGGTVFGEKCDVANAQDVAKFFARADDVLGRLDILVNNAGVGIFRPVADLTPEDWQKTLDTN